MAYLDKNQESLPDANQILSAKIIYTNDTFWINYNNKLMKYFAFQKKKSLIAQNIFTQDYDTHKTEFLSVLNKYKMMKIRLLIRHQDPRLINQRNNVFVFQ